MQITIFNKKIDKKHKQIIHLYRGCAINSTTNILTLFNCYKFTKIMLDFSSLCVTYGLKNDC